MPISTRIRSALSAFLWLLCVATPLRAQTVDDGIMLAKGELLTGTTYTHDSWEEYWEGALKRTNGNIGEITTEINVFTANYGLASRLNIIGMVPYVRTNASQGVLHGITGFQDLTIAAKYSAADWTFGRAGTLEAIAVGVAGLPMTDYNPELLPLSIGFGSKRASARGTLDYQTAVGLFATGSAAYTWRSDVQLDRPYFFTDGEFVMSDRADMPNVFDHMVSVGYLNRGLMSSVFLARQKTLGGGDIRRQDMPFVSNRMDFTRLGAMVMLPVPRLRTLTGELAIARTMSGRNVGQATTITFGFQYVFNGEPVQ
jgi:hypothetical protein